MHLNHLLLYCVRDVICSSVRFGYVIPCPKCAFLSFWEPKVDSGYRAYIYAFMYVD